MKQEEKKEKFKLPFWVWIIVVIMTIFNTLMGSVYGLIFTIMSIIFGTICMNWAKEIKASSTKGFLIGFILGLFGLIGYWFYYNNKKKIKNI